MNALQVHDTGIIGWPYVCFGTYPAITHHACTVISLQLSYNGFQVMWDVSHATNYATTLLFVVYVFFRCPCSPAVTLHMVCSAHHLHAKLFNVEFLFIPSTYSHFGIVLTRRNHMHEHTSLMLTWY